MTKCQTVFIFTVSTVLVCVLGSASAETIISREQVAEYAVVRDIRTEDGGVSGVVVNNSGHLLRNVELLIRYDWLWEDERSPGHNDPGRAVRYTLPEEIPPGGEVPFTYRPESPLPRRPDGQFITSVAVVSFTQFEEVTRRE